MRTPPFIVNKYFFPYVEVAADPEFSPKEPETSAASFETKVSIEKDNESKNVYQVMIEITLFPENEEKKIPYSIHLVAVGLFTAKEENKDIEKLLSINGASILYSAAREFIITLTSRGPWPAVILPTVSFIPPEDKPIEETDQNSTIKKSGRKKQKSNEGSTNSTKK